MSRPHRSVFAGLTATVIALTLAASASAQPAPAASAAASAAPANAAPANAAPAPAPQDQAPVPVVAATIPATTGTPLRLRSAGASGSSDSPSSSGALWKLGALSAIIAAAAWWLKKKRGLLGAGTAPPKTIQVLSRASVGVRTELVVVEVDGMTLLLGVTPASVSRLAILGAGEIAPAKEEAAPEELDEGVDPKGVAAQDLGIERFAKLLEGVKKSTPAPRLVVKDEPMPVEPQARGLLALRKR
jgi:flagellar biogenesis protein FliO